MSNDKSKACMDDDAFVERARELFDDSVGSLDGGTRSELNRRRHEALEAAAGRRFAPRPIAWLPAAGAAAAVLVAVFLIGNDAPVGPGIPAPAADIEILLEGDDLEMLGELEFYSWIDLDAATTAHVG